jgi:hypothetical protein
MKPSLHIVLCLLVCVLTADLPGQTASLNGQAIGWTTINPTDPFQLQGGIRYIPEFKFNFPVGKLSIAGEASLNGWGALSYSNKNATTTDHQINPYRLWVKLSGNQFELRAGLQKINFGSAKMLRPLMWFDKIDPRDPLQLTDGVYGLLGRYYFLNNANIWVWGLYGNNEPKGLEQFPTKKRAVEYGGRVQVPVIIGEAALSFHHREANPDAILPDSLRTGNTYPENRIAFDTKVDLAVGLWLEGSLTQHNFDFTPFTYTTLLNAGVDYTFNMGNGLNIMGESFFFLSGENPFASDQALSFAGITLSYPLNIIHNISGIVFYDITNRELYRFINWSATFDRWTFYTMAFWNPKNYQLYNFQQETSLFGGAGFQLMAVFNH